jgi:hypothetical protein
VAVETAIIREDFILGPVHRGSDVACQHFTTIISLTARAHRTGTASFPIAIAPALGAPGNFEWIARDRLERDLPPRNGYTESSIQERHRCYSTSTSGRRSIRTYRSRLPRCPRSPPFEEPLDCGALGALRTAGLPPPEKLRRPAERSTDGALC